MKKILVYTFYNYYHITFKLVRDISSLLVEKYYIRGKNGHERFMKLLENNDFSHILGLGDFRKNSRRIRIEEKFINKYGKKKILPKGPQFYKSSWKLPLLSNEIYTSNKASNGPCNRSAYLASHITNEIKTKVAFIHIPRNYDFEEASKLVKSWLTI